MFLFLFLILISAFYCETQAKLFDSKSFELQNGMQVVVVENHRAPVVSSMIWYNVGSVDETYGKSGLAHFLEHLMFKGTEKFKNGEFSDFISKNGGTENAFTSFDYTAYYQIIPSEKIEKILEMEADRMKNLVLSKKQIETEKSVILEERSQRIDSSPSSVLDESMRKSLFPNHTYGTPIIGWKHEIENLTYEDIFEFYNKYYDPSNAVLVLSGDIKIKDAKRITKKYFGKIKSNKVKQKRNYLTDPPLKTKIQINHEHPNVEQPIWKKLYKTISLTESIDDGLALDIGLEIIAGGKTSILYQELVTKQKIFAAVGGYYQGLTKGPGNIYFYAIPNKNLSPKDIDIKINDVLKNVIKKGISPDDFNRKKKEYYYNFIYQQDGIGKPAQIIGEALSVGIKLEDLENWDQRINELSIEKVNEALNRFLENKNFVTGMLK